MGWNLPAGVTGAEPQIAGYPEQEIGVTCETPDCGFTGEVTAVISGDMLSFECPTCGIWQEQEYEPYDPYAP